MFIYRRNVLLVHKSASLSLVAADSLDTLASAQSTTSHDGFLLIQAELMGSRVVILGLLNGQVVMRIVSIVEQQDGQVDFEVVAEEVILQTKNFHILLATHDDKVAIIRKFFCFAAQENPCILTDIFTEEFSNTLFVYSVSTRETRTYNFPVKARSINFLSKDYVAIAHGDTIRVFDLVYGASHSTIDLPMQGIPTRLSIEHMESETGDNLMVTFTTKASKMATTFLLPYYAAPLTLLSCLGKITRQNSAPFPKWPTMMAKIAQKDLPGFQAEFSELVKRSDDENTEERSIPACLTPQVMCTLMKSLLEAFETLPDNIVSYMLSARVSPKSGIVDHLMRKLNFPLIAQCVSLDLTMQDITNLFQLSFEHNEIDIVKSLIQKYGTESGLSYTLRALNMTQVETCLSSCVDWLQEKDWVQPDDDHETILTFLSSVIDAHLPMILMTPPLHPYLTALKLIVGDHRKEMEITRREMSGVLGEFSMKKQVQHAGNRVKQMMNMTRDGVGRYRIEVVEF